MHKSFRVILIFCFISFIVFYLRSYILEFCHGPNNAHFNTLKSVILSNKDVKYVSPRESFSKFIVFAQYLQVHLICSKQPAKEFNWCGLKTICVKKFFNKPKINLLEAITGQEYILVFQPVTGVTIYPRLLKAFYRHHRFTSGHSVSPFGKEIGKSKHYDNDDLLSIWNLIPAGAHLSIVGHSLGGIAAMMFAIRSLDAGIFASQISMATSGCIPIFNKSLSAYLNENLENNCEIVNTADLLSYQHFKNLKRCKMNYLFSDNMEVSPIRKNQKIKMIYLRHNLIAYASNVIKDSGNYVETYPTQRQDC
jgi:hypothetical protein